MLDRSRNPLPFRASGSLQAEVGEDVKPIALFHLSISAFFMSNTTIEHVLRVHHAMFFVVF